MSYNADTVTFKQTLLAIAVATALSACGGGGGGGGDASPSVGSTPTRPTPSYSAPGGSGNDNEPCESGMLCMEHDKKNDSKAKAGAASFHLNDYAEGNLADGGIDVENEFGYKNMINHKTAAEQGLTGKGVTVGVVDGEGTQRPELSAAYSEYLKVDNSGGRPKVVSGDPSPVNAESLDHMDMVSYIVAGRAEKGYGAGGIAKDAKVVAVDGDNRSYNTETVVASWNALLNRGVKVINNSWGIYTTTHGQFDEFNREVVEHNKKPGSLSDLKGALKKGVDRGALFVFSSGNSATTQPNGHTLHPVFDESLRKGVIVVAGVDAKGVIQKTKNGGSNHCGLAAEWCLVAPYELTVKTKGVDYTDSFYNRHKVDGDVQEYTYTGTSVSAPQVTGTAALLLQKYPWMTNDNLRTTILTTAQDLGPKGVDSYYGWGLLNVGKAVSGPAQFAFGDFTADTGGTAAQSYRFDNAVSGRGGLVKKGASELVLSAKNTYTGKTRIENGTLTVLGSTVSDTAVGKNGMLGLGKGAVVGNVDNSGWLHYGLGNARIAGNLTLRQGGTLYTKLGNLLSVDGTAKVAGRLWLDSVGAYAKKSGTKVDFLKTGKGVSGTFDEVKTDGALLASVYNVETDAGGKTLSYTVVRRDGNAAGARLAHQAAPAFAQAVRQSGENLENLMSELDTRSEQELSADRTAGSVMELQGAPRSRAAVMFERLAATVYADSTAVYVETRGKRLKDISAALDERLPEGSFTAFGKAYHDRSKWSEGGADGKLSHNGQSAGLKAGLGNGMTLIAALDAGRTDWSESSSARSENRSTGASAGLRYDFGTKGAYVKGLVSYGAYKNSVKRTLGLGAEEGEGTVRGSLWQFGLLAGQNLPFLTDGNLNVEGGLRYDLLNQKAFAENGGPLSWRGNALKEGTGVGIVNVRASYPVWKNAAVYAGAGLERDLSRRHYGVTGGFNGAAGATGRTGEWNMPHTRWTASAGASAELGHGWSLRAGYRYTGSSHYRSHSADAGVAYRF